MSTVLYVRISDENYGWVQQLAKESGLSLTKVADALLNYCRKQGITFVSEVCVVGGPDAH